MAQDAFPQFSLNQQSGTEPLASSDGQVTSAPAATPLERHEPRGAETPAKPEQPHAALDAQTTRIESTTIEIDRLEELLVFGLEGRLQRIQKLSEADPPLALGKTMFAQLEKCAVGAIAQLESILKRFRSPTDRIAPSLAEADRLVEVVSGVEKRIATLVEREHFLTRAADQIAPSLAEVDRLVEVVSAVEKRIGTLLESEQSLTHTQPIVGQSDRHHAFEPVAPHRQLSLDAERPGDGRSRLIGSEHSVGRLAVAFGVAGILTTVAVGTGLVGRRPRTPVQTATIQGTSEGHSAAASSPVLPSRPLEVPIPPTPLAAMAPITHTVIPAVLKSASGKSRSSKATTHQRARSPHPERDRSAPPVFAGDLAVQSNPAGGTVFIDRRRVGETPLRLTRIPAGSHAIWIESEGHARWTAAVQVNTDKLVQVSANLQPER